jgi:vacuolar-type H+-ATPase subunit E/Vma4
MNRFLHHVVLVAGLAAVCWAGAGYIGSSPLALTITVLVAAFYLIGALELQRFRQATSTLARATAEMQDPPASLGHWLEQLHPSLQSAVRLRIEGERVGLPGPALTPYLAGLLVLLGMLGTFLGMVVTLKGTGIALESATDLQAVRASLSAPVKGLGLAFGTSVAGVAASAMLGLASALCRRERLQAGQRLDQRIATTLRGFSLAHQREESFKLLQRQDQAMPELVDRLQLMMATMERQSEALNERLVSSQDRFHRKTEATYADLASSVGQSLNESLIESARIAGATIRPVVEATMAGIARETASLHDSVAHTVQQQLDGLSIRFEATHANVAQTWKGALAEHQRTSEALSETLRNSHDHFAETFEGRSASLVQEVSSRLQSTMASVSDTWGSALAKHQRVSERQSGETHKALATVAATFGQHSDSLLRNLGQAHVDLQAEMASRDAQRVSAWTHALKAMAASLQQEWQQAGAQSLSAQQQLCEALAQTARDMSAQTGAHAENTVAEIARLLQTASEAPRAAAEVIAELRQKLSDSMARDNAMLEERRRILETLETLLDAVNHASGEQRTAIDALVASSAEVLDRVGSRFTDTVATETEKMAAVAAQITGSAVEVASLGDAFGFAVQLFSESNDKLGAHLQRIEGALGKSIVRSDEQLAYYVAQAREVIDLSIMSQKQIVDDLQRLASRQVPAGAEAR